MLGELIRRGPDAGYNGSELYVVFMDVREAVDTRWLAARGPESMVQIPSPPEIFPSVSIF